MRISSKLAGNTLVLVFIGGSIAISAVIGMRRVRERVSDLTDHETM